jgi:SAM-dependent methyltransferase
VGEASVPFLAYSQNLAGWNDDLTSLHRRESAGLHPIDITSRHNALAALRQALPSRPASVLEVGSSEGHLLRDLRKAYPEAAIVGSEVAAQALRHIAAEQPGIPLLQLDILNCPLPAGSFDAVIALNVLEHIEDDVTALANMARLLAVGGILIVEVPAGPGLYDSYDRQLRHYRRYTMTEIKRKIMQAELKVERHTHVGCLVYPAFA